MEKLIRWLFMLDRLTTQQVAYCHRLKRNWRIAYALIWLVLVLSALASLAFGNFTWSNALGLVLTVHYYLVFIWISTILTGSYKANISPNLTKAEFERKDNRKLKRLMLVAFITYMLLLPAFAYLINFLAPETFHIDVWGFPSLSYLGILVPLIYWYKWRQQAKNYQKEM